MGSLWPDLIFRDFLWSGRIFWGFPWAGWIFLVKQRPANILPERMPCDAILDVWVRVGCRVLRKYPPTVHFSFLLKALTHLIE